MSLKTEMVSLPICQHGACAGGTIYRVSINGAGIEVRNVEKLSGATKVPVLVSKIKVSSEFGAKLVLRYRASFAEGGGGGLKPLPELPPHAAVNRQVVVISSHAD